MDDFVLNMLVNVLIIIGINKPKAIIYVNFKQRIY